MPPHRAGWGSLQPFGNWEGLCPNGHTLLSLSLAHSMHGTWDQQITDTFEAITQESPDSPSLRLSVRPSSFLFFSSSPYLGLSAAHLLLAPHSSSLLPLLFPCLSSSVSSSSLPLSASFMVDLLKQRNTRISPYIQIYEIPFRFAIQSCSGEVGKGEKCQPQML